MIVDLLNRKSLQSSQSDTFIILKQLLWQQLPLQISILPHCVKSVPIRSFFWYEYRKIQTRKNSVFRHFSCSVILDNNIFAIINHLRKQHKGINQDKIYNELIKTIDLENKRKEHVHDRINELIIQGKTVNKPNRNDDSYRVNESIVDFNIEQLKYSNLPTSDLPFPHLILNSHLPLNP